MDPKDSVLSSFSLLTVIAGFGSATDICHAACVNKAFHEAYNRDQLWEQLCNQHGFKPLTSSTRTRGRQSYRSIYAGSICIECRNVDGSKGSVVIDTNGGSYTRMGGVDGPSSALVVLCINCFRTVQKFTTHGDRMRFALTQAKHRLPYHVWTTVLGKVPLPNKHRKKKATDSNSSATNTAPTNPSSLTTQKRKRDRYEDPKHNDYLIRKIPK